MTSPLEQGRVALGRDTVRYAITGGIIGVAALVAGFALGQASTVLAALAAMWLLFAGVAAGGVALSAAIRIAQGRWASGLLPTAESCSSFFIPAWAILAALVAAAPVWIPDFSARGSASWMFLAARELGATALLFWLGRRFVRRAREGSVSMQLALVYVLVYVVTLTIWTIDFVIGLHDWAPSTILPPYYFMCSFLAALAWATLTSTAMSGSRIDATGRHDAGKLLFGMITFCGYLLWSAFLPVWYGNIPDETAQLLARWGGPYKVLTVAYVTAAFLVPFVGLVLEDAKRNPAILSAGAASVLLGLTFERFLLVFPSLPIPTTGLTVLLSIGIAIGMLASFVLAFASGLGQLPKEQARSLSSVLPNRDLGTNTGYGLGTRTL